MPPLIQLNADHSPRFRLLINLQRKIPYPARIGWGERSEPQHFGGKSSAGYVGVRYAHPNLYELAKHRIRPWPYPGPIALVERDEFGMREDAHVIDAWEYLGTARDEAALQSLFASAAERRDSGHPRFDADIYRIVGKCLKEGRLRVIAAPC
jgi:hypothetical protein